ncbi:MAG: triple tyrosine motif-containing protein [Winogradskyella sp.]|uniref:triple tyrosine motif-containing protein n=1 Tax=Winogradskyella sp. TaxID=1883156 RepID=UPI00385FAB0D
MNSINKMFGVLTLLVGLLCYGQEIPPIQIFTPQDYGAEDQNWAISQSNNNFIYVANSKGLLEYNGASWQLYNSPNEGILRSVKVVGEKIYSGGYMDFGYWTRTSQGSLAYTSLSDTANISIKEDEEFWGIINIEGYILFQSFEHIYIYNTTDDSFGIINSESRINKMFQVDETIYFQKKDEGVFRIENGKQTFILSALDLDNNELVNIFSDDSGLLLQTKEQGFYSFDGRKVERWNLNSEGQLSDLSIYSSIRLRDGSFLLGTIANGIIQMDNEGNELLKIDQACGLSNNTVLSVMEDNYGNIWLGLDNGINVINLNSPYRVYTDKQGMLGTVYTAAKTEEHLYLGTNQGLFYKALQSNDKFKFIEGTKGQVWSLSLVKGVLFCGHDKGTFVINKASAEKISSQIGTWSVKEIDGDPDILIQGNYKGLIVLEKVDDSWRYRNKIEGFDISARYFESVGSNEFLVSHEHKGVYKVRIDEEFKKVINYTKLPINDGIKSGMVKSNNSVLYTFKEGVYRYNVDNEMFKKDTLLSELFSGSKYISGKLFNDLEGNKLWGFSEKEIIYIEPGKLSSEPKINVIAMSSELRKSKSAYENILYLENDNYLIGTTEGYLIVDLNKLENKALNIHLTRIDYGSRSNDLKPLDLNGENEFGNKVNNIRFKYSVTNYSKLSTSKFQYKLNGFYDNWSNWSSNPEVFFKNLPHGEYTFEARALTDGILSTNIVSHKFTIDKPWYLKPLAIVSYVLLALLFIYVLYHFNKRHYKREQQKLIENKERQLELEQLENQRQVIQFKNQNLQLDIENKNRELGMATMNLVKRNELLNSIKEELSKSKSLSDVTKVVKLINSNLNNTNDWELFEEAFNNVDKDFMKKIKTLHPSITPNDLRLCAYLRLNLSSKEIAPLLNISHKSVEVKRYRLRKKMELDHDQSLSNYIIEI